MAAHEEKVICIFEPTTVLTGRAFNYIFAIQIIWKNGPFRNRENLKYKKTADSVLLSLFMKN